jgi:hypothetical protein
VDDRRVAAALQPRPATYPLPSDPGEMGYADQMRFEPADLALLAETEEIQIETARPGGPSHRTTIWIVVDGDDAFVRSVNGSRARWYREAVDDPSVTIDVANRALAARAEPATDPSSVQRTSDAFARKYGRDPAMPTMLVPEILETTLRLVPA